MTLFSQLGFGAPWVLLALVVLPAIWFLLRVTPPSPKRVVFPPLRLLLGLKDSEETPARTPPWLLLLRMLAAALAILALAEPLLGQSAKPEGSGPVILLVDNGWSAAHQWDRRTGQIADTLRAAGHDGRAVAIVTTADVPDTSLLDAGEAARRAGDLAPRPWTGDRRRALAALAKAKFPARPEILWLSDGLDDGHARETADALARLGNLKVFATPLSALALMPPRSIANGYAIEVQRAGAAGVREGNVQAEGGHGEILSTAHFRFDDGKNTAAAKIVLPLQVRNEMARLAIMSEETAGAVQLLDSGAPRRAVGLVSASNVEGEQPLLSDTYYLERALAPYADVRKATISRLLDEHVGVLALADIGRIAGSDRDRVANS